MLNIQRSKNTVLILIISFITFLKFAFYTRAASLLASRGRTSRGRGQDPQGRGHDPRGQGQTHEAEARFFGLEAEPRPRGLTSLLFIILKAYMYVTYAQILAIYTIRGALTINYMFRFD